MALWTTTHPWKERLELDSAYHITDVLDGNKFILVEIMYYIKHKHSGREVTVQ